MQRTLVKALVVMAGLGSWVVAPHEAQAQEAKGGHTHASPHGGEVVEVSAGHVEFKADSSGAIQVWLLDGKLQTVTPPAGASVTLISDDAQVTVPLQVDQATKGLTGRFDARKLTKFQAVVSMPISGKKQNVRFRYPHH